MGRYLDELQAVVDTHRCPVFYAGDIFHTWKSPPELINFALEHLPNGYAIPGQHDLPLHQYDDIHKSAYWTLAKTGHIFNLIEPIRLKKLCLYPFPWDAEIKPLTQENMAGAGMECLHVAIVHKYLWAKSSDAYPGAPVSSRFSEISPSLKGYDAAFFGDNHKGFILNRKKYADKDTPKAVMNCGGFYRSKSDEKEYRPRIGLLKSDGSIEPYYLDVSEDQWEEEVNDLIKDDPMLASFLESLEEVKEVSLDFAEVVKRRLEHSEVSKPVKLFVLKWLEDK